MRGKKRVLPEPKISPIQRKRMARTALLISVSMLVLAGIVFFLQMGSALFDFLFWVGLLVFGVNAFWLSKNFSKPFIIPYFLLMVKTKKLVKQINEIAHHGKWLEKIAFFGLFAGFGLTWVDYWKARKLGGWKRILLLFVFAIIFGLFFYFGLGIMFVTPALQPIFLFSMVGFILLGFGGLSLAILIGYGFLSLIALFSAEQICPSVAPVLPGIPIPGMGGFTIPAIAWVSLGMILVIHELSHGIMMAYYKKKIHSVGLLLAGVFPLGAFVEEDTKEFAKAKDKESLMMLSAGPASNLFTMIIGIILLLAFSLVISPISPIFDAEAGKMYSGVMVEGVDETISFCGIDENAPAFGKLEKGDIIASFNGVDINGLAVLNKEFVFSGTDMNFVVKRADKNVFLEMKAVVFKDLNIKRVGAQFESIKTSYEPKWWYFPVYSFINSIGLILLFFVILSFAVGMFNYLPSDPLDGGKIAKIVLEPYAGFMNFTSKKETRKFIGRLFMWLVLISLLLNLLPYIGILF